MSGVSADRVALTGSMPEYIQSLLAGAPRLCDPARQQALTDRFLTPALPALKALLLGLRAELDPALRDAHPHPKPYPLGQCLRITEAVEARLASLDPTGFSGPVAEGCAALRGFRAAGGMLRRAWGDLRGEYFQNALIVGTLYVDVSNDTVVIDKPPVEIRAFAEADFRPIADYGHFARIAERYWRHRILPNHLLPELAPYLPLIHIGPTGQVSFGPTNRYMLGVTLANGFAPSEQALAGPALPPRLFAGLSAALRAGPSPVAASAEQGRASALACCRAYRAERRDLCAAAYNRALAAGREANRRLERLVATPQGHA